MNTNTASNESATGVHGYSGPNKPHIVFSVDLGMEEYTRRVLADQRGLDGVSIEWGEGRGSWEGVEEVSFFVEAQWWWNGGNAMLAMAVRDQEAFLVLGYLEAQNYRKAQLIDNDAAMGKSVYAVYPDPPKWYSVSEKEAKSHADWSFFNGQYFRVSINPPRCHQEKLDRETAQLIADLRLVVWNMCCSGRYHSADDAIKNNPAVARVLGYGPDGRYIGSEHSVASKSFSWLRGKTLVSGRVLKTANDVAEVSCHRK